MADAASKRRYNVQYAAANAEILRRKRKARYLAKRTLLLAQKKEYYVKNKAAIRAKIKEYILVNRDRVAARARAKYHASDKVKQRAYNRAYRGLPEPTRAEPVVCDCCGNLPNGKGKRLHLDHCHSTGRFRGWLCHSCNAGIGLLGDTLRSVLRAVLYLELHGSDT